MRCLLKMFGGGFRKKGRARCILAFHSTDAEKDIAPQGGQ